MEIKGVEFSEETIVGWARQAGISFEEPKKPYQFQAGDVVKTDTGTIRIIVEARNVLYAINTNGYCVATGQEVFKFCGYKKIGEIQDVERIEWLK